MNNSSRSQNTSFSSNEALDLASFSEGGKEYTNANIDNENINDNTPIPQGKSIAHNFMPYNLVFISFDLETIRENSRIVQLSAVAFCIDNHIDDT